MHSVAVVSALAEVVLSLLLGLAVAFLSFRVFGRMTRSLDEIGELKRNNAAAGILIAAILLSTALVVRTAIYPAVSALQTGLVQGISAAAAARLAGLAVLYAVLAAGFAVAVVPLAGRVFMALTRDIDELAEVRESNVAVALTLGTVIVVLGLFAAHGVQALLAALIPYPALETIKVMGVS
jgi:uncharacterized membrane protein YjfL (UPF0719 family)